ncbi:MAG TPA: protein kinase, partial [Vicinamibacterales bacterium]|nr:protein kinase [Vicinamibacterales bacterium]
GPYQIVEKLGAGGMGEVYRATDEGLGRDVAIKILPETFARDADRLARFQREARTLASLNHPNIAQVFGLERADGLQALVMELVDGEDLSAHIARGPIALAETVSIALQMAQALEVAHESGIVHRDLKPANVKVRSDGAVKVLDFGLAKALGSPAAGDSGPTADVANSPTLTAPATQIGMILGTAAYMAPEQAKGKAVDRRADIWAFGVVLYEMLTGSRAFEREDVSETLAAVLTRDLNFATLPPTTPARLRVLIRDCLARDPRQRLRDIGDARRVLEQLSAGTPEEEAASLEHGPVAAPPTPLWRRALPWAVGAVAVAAVWLGTRPSPAPLQPTTRTTIELPDGLSVVRRDRALALSPDGTQLALVLTDARNRSQLYLRAIADLEMRALANTDGATYPFWAPDGRALGFFAAGELKRIDLPDGLVRSITPATQARGGTWGPDDTAVFAAASDEAQTMTRLFRVSMASPGSSTAVGLDPTPQQVARLPVFVGGRVLFDSHHRLNEEATELRVLDLSSGETRRLGGRAGEVHYVAPGLLASLNDSILTVQPFDPQSFSLSGTPVVLASGVSSDPNRGTGHVSFPRNSNTSFVYLQDAPTPMRQLTWIDADGRESGTLGEPARVDFIAPSPDGRRALIGIDNQDGHWPQLWMMDLATGSRSPFTGPRDGGRNVAWSPDGRRVAYTGPDTRLVVRPADGGTDRIVFGNPAHYHAPFSWTADGASILIAEYRGVRGTDLALVAADGKGVPRYLIESPAQESFARLSPDGRWVAYVSDESGRQELYVAPFETPGARWPLTTTGMGSDEFGWQSNSEIAYIGIDGQVRYVLWKLEGDRLTARSERPAFGGRTIPGVIGSLEPVSGRYLVAVPLAGQTLRQSLVLVTNWQSALKK